ncbi:hypothetical protein [Microscilla marina]|uniref:Uncharacterized protein n=1 Tax=Microscilla marina ATCC 23134 TaxID=313606 RepID=A1ZL58_MICM2|nr:hypothetical protein [Microscilla marina]EAY29024.1 hypothetical protein M23134_00178 [Microscilla marina ATCC 23134]
MQQVKKVLQEVFALQPQAQTHVWQWHQAQQWKYLPALRYSLQELGYHFELLPEKKQDLLTCEEYLKTYTIRENGRKTWPNEWVDATKGTLDQQGLDHLWLKPDEGYLVKLLKASGEEQDLERLKKVVQSKAFKYRGLDKNIEERKQARLRKLQQSIDKQEVVLFLGRQNRVYKALQQKLNERYAGKLRFISDHIWSSRGYIEPGVKASDNRLSLIQAAETIHRLPTLGLSGEAIAQRFIMFSLDNYNAKTCMAAMYSDCNRIARSDGKPKIEGIDKFAFAYTGLTDLELANIVRNKHWLSYTRFCRTGANGEPEELSQQQVLEEYGIKEVPLV